VIHFNNGMHGAGYSEEEYAAALPALLATLRRYAPNAKLIWASTTDVRQRDHMETVDPKTDRIVQRNRDAAAIAQRENIPIDDLFSLVRGHPDYHAQDGVHFSDKGSEILAAQVSDSIAKLLH
jgi:lysophospholipase L1-like esterase